MGDDGRCEGCGRTRQHLIEWGSYSTEKREEVMVNLRKLGYKNKNNNESRDRAS